MGDVVPIEEGHRIRRKRAERAIAAPDWLWMATIAFWPLAVSLFVGQAVIERLQGSRR